MRVHRHTVPYFIPLQKLEKELLNANLRVRITAPSCTGDITSWQQFVDEVSNYIDAYITRREQLLLLQRSFTLENVASNASFDLVQFDILYKDRCDNTTTVVSK